MNKILFMLSKLLIIILNINAVVLSQSPNKHFPQNDASIIEKITFYSERNGTSDIYICNPNGTDLHRLTFNSAEDKCPALSRIGNKIAFSSNRDGNYELYTIDGNGNNLNRLTNTPENESHAEWSPDGTKIAFTVFSNNSWITSNIFTIDSSGNNVQQLTFTDSIDIRPMWSSDGNQILFNSRRDGNYEIYKMEANGNNQQPVTTTNTQELFPMWSPDGSKITYALVNFQLITSEVHLMNADGTGDTTLTNTGGVNEDPVWSPDGEFIAFQSDRNGNYEVYVMEADGSNQTRITINNSWDGWPSWGIINEQNTSIKYDNGKLQPDFRLMKNYPNPFNSATTIEYNLQKSSKVILKIYNTLGQEVRTLIDKFQSYGIKSVVWDGMDNSGKKVSSGVYVYRIQSEADDWPGKSKKLLILK